LSVKHFSAMLVKIAASASDIRIKGQARA